MRVQHPGLGVLCSGLLWTDEEMESALTVRMQPRLSDTDAHGASANELARLARRLYVAGPYLLRKMMHYRIAICPFERLIAQVPPGASVLDVGCGAGLFLALLAGTRSGIRGVGFDSSGAAIDVAVRMAERLRLLGIAADLRFLHRDVAAPWPDELFDVVSLVDVLHHVPPAHQREVIENAARHVKPGGILLYKDMANRPAFYAWMNRLHDLIVARQWIHYLPIDMVERWAQEFELTPTHADTFTRLWYRHELRIFVKPPHLAGFPA